MRTPRSTRTDTLFPESTLFRSEGKNPPKPGEGLKKDKVIETILAKHDAATNGRKFNAVLATANINDAIEYFEAFKAIQAKKQKEDDTFQPLNVVCVFSPPAEGTKDVKQMKEEIGRASGRERGCR